jgi:hypothetical protein
MDFSIRPWLTNGVPIKSRNKLESNLPAKGPLKGLHTHTTLDIVLLLICSSFLAFYHANAAYNTDEVWSVSVSSLNYQSRVAALEADVHPPLYFHLLHFWIRLFGTGERTVRSLSGVFYIFSVLGIYGLGRELYGRRTALLSAVIYLSSPLAILAAQFARMYSLLSFLAILSTWLYVQFAVRPRDSQGLTALYVAINVLGSFTHIAFFFLLFGQIVVGFLSYRRVARKRLFFPIGLSLLPYLVLWGPTLVRQIAISREATAWVRRPDISMMADLMLQYGGTLWLVVPLLLYLRFWSVRPQKASSNLSLSRLPLWLLGVTILTPLLISTIKPVFNSRLAIIGLPLFALSVGPIAGPRANYLLPLALFVLTLAFLPLVHPASVPCDNRELSAYLAQTAHDDDVVIFTSLTRLPIDFYLEKTRAVPKLFETSFPAEIDQHPGYEGRIGDPARKLALEREARELVNKIGALKYGRVFFLHGFHPQVDAIMEHELRDHFKVLAGNEVNCSDTTYFKAVSVYQ